MIKLDEYVNIITESLEMAGKTVGDLNDTETDFNLNVAEDIKAIMIGSVRERAAYCWAKFDGSKIKLIEHRDLDVEIELADPDGLHHLAKAILLISGQDHRIGNIVLKDDPRVVYHGAVTYSNWHVDVPPKKISIANLLSGHYHQR